MASEFPYIQLYVADYLADTVHLSTEEHGAYLLLIMNYWQTGKPIPKSRLASAARMFNGRWTDVEQTLKEFFKEDEQGRWVHPRIEQELAKVRRKSRQASAAGKASAKKRAEMQSIDVKEDSNGRSTEIQRTFNHTDTDTDTDTEKEREKHPKIASLLKEETLPEEWKVWANKERQEIDADREFEIFHDYWLSLPDSKARKKDWFLTWKNWIRRSRNFSGKDFRAADPRDFI